MKTFVIKSVNDLEQHKDDYGIHIKGHADIQCSLGLEELPKRLLVDGSLSIEAGWYIEARGYIEAGGCIEAGGSIEAAGSIEAGWYIEAAGYIKAGGSIEAGGSYGISAGLSIQCKGELSFGLKAYAGICTRRKISEDEKTITCGKLVNGKVECGILKETGLVEDDATKQAMELLKKNGYKIVKE